MIIRDAEAPDIPRIRRLVKNLWQETNQRRYTKFDGATVENTVRSMMAAPNGVMKVATINGRIIGIGGAMAFPYHWNANHITAQEFFWWVEPDATGQGVGSELVRHMEIWARSVGAKTFVMSHQAKHDMTEYLEKLGYAPLERSFTRIL